MNKGMMMAGLLAGCWALIGSAQTIKGKAADGAVKTGLVRGGEAPRAVEVDITGLKTLFLGVTDGGDGYSYDQAVWADAKLIAADGRAIALASLKPAQSRVGWGKPENRPTSIGGKKFSSALQAHGPSLLQFTLDGAYARFHAQVGIDDAAGKKGSVVFIVAKDAPEIGGAPDAKGKPAPQKLESVPADQAPHTFNAEAARLLRTRGIAKLLFVRRFTLTNSHIYTEHIDSKWMPGGGLCLLDLASGRVTELTPQLAGGVVNRFDLSFDAKKIVFDYKRGPKEGYRIYEMNIDGTGLRQLTFPEANDTALLERYGYGTNDMHPCYLQDGSIMFTSTRCLTSTLCNASDVYTTPVIHRMDADGKNIRRLSSNCVSEFCPAVLPDGRILYMRWEYNRKGAGAVKCLWSMRPDGTASAEVYGNQIIDPESMLYGRPIPGTRDKISFLGCSHWGPNNGVGTVIVLDTQKDIASPDAMRRITQDVDARTHGGYSFLVGGKWIDEKSGTPGRLFKDPYPLAETAFLAAMKPKGLPWGDPRGYALVLLDETGADTPLYQDETISCWHPYPVVARTKPPMPVSSLRPELARADQAQCLVTDVYTGLSGVKRGTVKHLRILEQTARPWAARNRWPGDKQNMAHTALGPYVLGLHVQHGIVPVETDGSANFLVPAGRNIYLQALDENYRAVQTERTYINYQPGETRSCIGCHEYARAGADVALAPSALALKRKPSTPRPQPGDNQAGRVIDYERQIQPIWNKHCVSCHGDNDKTAGGLDLRGTQTALHCVSYEQLLGMGTYKNRRNALPLVGRQADENDIRANIGYTPAYFFGAASSVLSALTGRFEPQLEGFGAKATSMVAALKKLRGPHKDVKLTPEEQLRLDAWLDTSCQYYPSYWGKKNLQHAKAPGFRPEITFEEALADRWPGKLDAIYRK